MKYKHLIVILALSAGIGFFGSSCSSSRKTTASADSASASQQMAAFKQQWATKMDSLNSEINQQEEKIDQASADKKEDLQKKLAELKTSQKELQQEIDAAGNKTAAQWADFKNEVANKYQSLKEQVSDFFNSDTD